LEGAVHGTGFWEVGVGIMGGGVVATPGTVTGIVGTVAPELTPKLPISMEPSGIPARGMPPCVVGDVGVEDPIRLFEPDPHIPDIPAVSIAPKADVVELCVIPEVIDIPEVAGMPDDMPGDAAMPPVAVPVAGIELAIDSPPPSKLVLEPNIWDDEAPTVEHGTPVEGVAIVPVGLGGTGLTPADVISVEPNGIPVGEMDELDDALPSGEVAPIAGVGTTMPFICAKAAWLARSAGRAATIGKNLMCTLLEAEDIHVRGQKVSGRLTTIGVGVLRTTTHLNG
jgi:hypothetical protein